MEKVSYLLQRVTSFVNWVYVLIKAGTSVHKHIMPYDGRTMPRSDKLSILTDFSCSMSMMAVCSG